VLLKEGVQLFHLAARGKRSGAAVGDGGDRKSTLCSGEGVQYWYIGRLSNLKEGEHVFPQQGTGHLQMGEGGIQPRRKEGGTLTDRTYEAEGGILGKWFAGGLARMLTSETSKGLVKELLRRITPFKGGQRPAWNWERRKSKRT